MVVFWILAAVGIMIVKLGISITKGNVHAIHWYHRQKITEEHMAVFAKLMGIGTIFCGFGTALFGILSFLSELAAQAMLMMIGSYLTIVNIAGGVGILIYATIKYNKI